MAEAPASRNRRQSKKAQDHHKTTNRKPRAKERRTWPKPQHHETEMARKHSIAEEAEAPPYTTHTDQRNAMQTERETNQENTG